MFYNNSECAFKILGVFLVDRAKYEGVAHNRTHTALSYRITGDSTFVVGQKNLRAESGSIVYIPKGINFGHKSMEEKRTDTYNRSITALYQLFSQLQKTYEPVASNLPPAIIPGVQLIQKNFKNPDFTISQLAAECCVSDVFFRKLYRNYFSESPLQTLLKLRFDYACTLLLSGYYTQKQVAELSGFSDVKYFRKAFKKYYGISPSQFIQDK